MMIVEVEKLINQTLRVKKAIPLVPGLQPRDGVVYTSPTLVDVVLAFRTETVVARGSFKTELLATCDRSLKRFRIPLSGSLDLVFRKDDSSIAQQELALSEDDMNVSFHQGFLDFSQVINEQVALSLPMKLLHPGSEETFAASFGKEDSNTIDDRFVILKELQDRMKKRNDS